MSSLFWCGFDVSSLRTVQILSVYLLSEQSWESYPYLCISSPNSWPSQACQCGSHLRNLTAVTCVTMNQRLCPVLPCWCSYRQAAQASTLSPAGALCERSSVEPLHVRYDLNGPKSLKSQFKAGCLINAAQHQLRSGSCLSLCVWLYYLLLATTGIAWHFDSAVLLSYH